MAALLADGIAGFGNDEADGVVSGPFYITGNMPLAGGAVDILSRNSQAVWSTDPNFNQIFGSSTNWTVIAHALTVYVPSLTDFSLADAQSVLAANLEHSPAGSIRPRFWAGFDRTIALLSASALDDNGVAPLVTWQTAHAGPARLAMPRAINVDNDTLFYNGQATTAGYDFVVRIDGTALNNTLLSRVPDRIAASGGYLQSVARSFAGEAGGWGVAGTLLATIRRYLGERG